MTKEEFNQEWKDHVKRINQSVITVNTPEVILEETLCWDCYKSFPADEFRKICIMVEGELRRKML